jgi:hypothetical protein
LSTAARPRSNALVSQQAMRVDGRFGGDHAGVRGSRRSRKRQIQQDDRQGAQYAGRYSESTCTEPAKKAECDEPNPASAARLPRTRYRASRQRRRLDDAGGAPPQTKAAPSPREVARVLGSGRLSILRGSAWRKLVPCNGESGGSGNFDGLCFIELFIDLEPTPHRHYKPASVEVGTLRNLHATEQRRYDTLEE